MLFWFAGFQLIVLKVDNVQMSCTFQIIVLVVYILVSVTFFVHFVQVMHPLLSQVHTVLRSTVLTSRILIIDAPFACSVYSNVAPQMLSFYSFVFFAFIFVLIFLILIFSLFLFDFIFSSFAVH